MQPTQPVRVKVYGLFSVTKKKYIYQLVLSFLMAGMAIMAWFRIPRFPPRPGASKSIDQAMWLIDSLPYLVVLVLCLVCVEAYFVFRAFARKEAEQQAELAKQQAPEPAPVPEASPPTETAAAEKEAGPAAGTAGPEHPVVSESKSE